MGKVKKLLALGIVCSMLLAGCGSKENTAAPEGLSLIHI